MKITEMRITEALIILEGMKIKHRNILHDIRYRTGKEAKIIKQLKILDNIKKEINILKTKRLIGVKEVEATEALLAHKWILSGINCIDALGIEIRSGEDGDEDLHGL